MKKLEITGCKEKAALLPSMDEIINKAPEVCPVDWALKVVEQARRDACGKTVPCRDGLWQIIRIVEDGTNGLGESEDLELLKELLDALVTLGCELTAEAAKRVLKSIELYSEEWEMHIKRKRCTALVCKSYYTVYADPAACTGNEDLTVCPEGAIAGGAGLISVVDEEKCTKCGKCLEKYPEVFKKYGAIKPRLPEAPVAVGSFNAEGGRRSRRR